MMHKVGDLVKIKSIDWYNKNKDKYGYIHGTPTFVPEMAVVCGKEAVIDSILDYNDFYTITITPFDCDPYFWADYMFED
jgi:hypothetical protein